MKPTKLTLAALAFAAWAQTPELVPVIAHDVARAVRLPGEIQPFLRASLHAKLSAYVERVLVDRGNVVKAGDLLIELSAPELTAQIAEAQSRVQAAESEHAQTRAQLAAA